MSVDTVGESTTLRTAARSALLIGAIGSEGLMLYAGRNNPSRPLAVLFTLWILSPFVALAFAEVISKRWPATMQNALHWIILLVAIGTLIVYCVAAFHPPKAQAAFPFVITAPMSWILSGAALGIAAFRRSRISH